MVQLEILQQKGITKFHALSWAESRIVLQQLESHPLTKASSIKGNGIFQDFDEAEFMYKKYPKVADTLKQVVEDRLKNDFVLPLKHSFNSVRLQRYCQGSAGISPHTDGKRFADPIAILILKDGGDFCKYKTKEDEDPEIIPATVGDVIVMNPSVIHAVQHIKQERYTITLRIDLTPTLPL